MAEAWQVFVGLTVVLALYAVGVAFGAPTSPVALLSLVLFGGAGLLAGQFVANRLE